MRVSSLPKAVTWKRRGPAEIKTHDLLGRKQTLYRYATQTTQTCN